MSKVRLNVSVEHDVAEAAKASDINISRLLEETLRMEVNMYPDEIKDEDISEKMQDVVRILSPHQVRKAKQDFKRSPTAHVKWKRLVKHITGYAVTKEELIKTFGE